MTYEHIVAGTFVSRPNRFTGNRTVVCHVKNTGRCRELLIPGAAVILEFHPDAAVSGRKTEYDLIGVYKNDLFINMDSQAPNKAAWEWLTSLDGSMDSCGCTEKAGSPFSPLGPYVPCDIRQEGTHGVDYSRKADFRWISLIRLPDFVTREAFDWAVREAAEKKQRDFALVE